MTTSQKELNTSDRPLVSFIVIAYNQEKYIKEAVKGAFSQTYKPLEIILSDDCSKDSTFQIMQEMASQYMGPHQIILNRNSENSGIGGHINKCMKISSGELVVIAAGDDISLPNRTSTLAQYWLQSNKQITSIFSNIILINESGDIIGNRDKNYSSNPSEALKKFDYILGCSHAWDRRIFNKFGPVDDQIVYEDFVLPFRSLLIGGVGKVDEPLVHYRRCVSHWKNSAPTSASEARVRTANAHKVSLRIGALEQARKDLGLYHDNDAIYRIEVLKAISEWKLYLLLLEKRYWSAIMSMLNLNRASYIRWHIRAIKRYIKFLISSS